MVVVPPNYYCVVRHPVVKDSDGNIVFESSGQVSNLDFSVLSVLGKP